MIDPRTNELVDLHRTPPPPFQHTMEPFDLTEFRESGLLYLANRTLHVHGVALAAITEDDGTVSDLQVFRTTDPLGLTYDEETEDDARRRLFSWLRTRL